MIDSRSFIHCILVLLSATIQFHPLLSINQSDPPKPTLIKPVFGSRRSPCSDWADSHPALISQTGRVFAKECTMPVSSKELELLVMSSSLIIV